MGKEAPVARNCDTQVVTPVKERGLRWQCTCSMTVEGRDKNGSGFRYLLTQPLAEANSLLCGCWRRSEPSGQLGLFGNPLPVEGKLSVIIQEFWNSWLISGLIFFVVLGSNSRSVRARRVFHPWVRVPALLLWDQVWCAAHIDFKIRPWLSPSSRCLNLLYSRGWPWMFDPTVILLSLPPK